uniref:Uncharacterized protein n=1 Tax=Strongyloides venezuelensis TaxID=75913 RepID=A0A0K0FPV8_STRVS
MSIPSTTRLSAVRVPVLSKQQLSIFPTNEIFNGSAQKIPNFCKATNEIFNAKDNSNRSSRGTTLVMIKENQQVFETY